MALPLRKIEEKLSQMILDKKFKGILDAGAGCLIVYEDQTPDHTYEQALETLGNMSKVVDALYVKAHKINAPPEEPKKDKDDKDKKEGKEEEKVLIKKKDKTQITTAVRRRQKRKRDTRLRWEMTQTTLAFV